ncbi:MAG: nucleotidyl transferase AbiEii/AbiGii toxin family protein [Christensenellales bacterium]
MNKAASVKARLMNAAEKEKRSYQELLQTYGLERVIYRLSRSKYATKFALKGGILLYALFDGKYARSTTDIDLLGMEISRERDAVREIFQEIFAVVLDDGVVIDPNSIRAEDIAQAKVYPGVRITAVACLERTKIPITIDIGFGDDIVPAPIALHFPAILDDLDTNVGAYSLESVVAEKLEAVAALGFLNSRYKDFFDICMLSRSFVFDGKQLMDAISATFTRRNTSVLVITAFEESFSADAMHQRRWEAFIKKKATLSSLTLSDVVHEIMRFLTPVLDALREGYILDKVWDYQASAWR